MTDEANVETVRIADTLDRLEQRIATLSGELARQGSVLEKLDSRLDSLLYMHLLDKAAPTLLRAQIPELPPEIINSNRDASGLGRSYAAVRLRREAGRMLLGLAMTLTALPFELIEQIVREAKHTARDDPHVYGHCLALFRNRGNYTWERLLPECDSFAHLNDWSPGYRHAWAICIECNGRLGREEKTTALIDTYVEKYGPHLLEDVPYAAYYAWKRGIGNERTAVAAALVEETEKNNRERLLETMLRGKSVAIVGGGSYEMGKGKGKEIDAHDLVVRIKYASPDNPSHVADYGRRTDIMCVSLGARGIGTPAEDWLKKHHFPDLGEVDTVILPHDLSRKFLDYEAMAKLMRWRERPGTKIIAPDREVLSGILSHFSYRVFTTGFFVLLMLKTLHPELSLGDLYGFYHKEHKSYAGEYFWHTSSAVRDPIDTHHDFEREKECFDILFGNKAKVGGDDEHGS